MILKILFALCFVLECVFTPLFLKEYWPNRTNKSHCLKMVCASLFVCVAVLSMYIADNFTAFAFTMLLGSVLGWIGDLFLHFNGQKTFAVGFVSFLAGHIVYIKAYINALNTYEDYNQFNIVEIIVCVLLVVVALICSKKFKVQFSTKLLQIAIMVYTFILILMFLKATALGVNYMLSGASDGIWALLVLFLGSLFFMSSDATIGILMFGGQKKNRPLKIFNIATYFAGQILLASSILFIKA